VLSSTYTTDSNVFSEKEEPLAVHSYELVPSAELAMVFDQKLRFPCSTVTALPVFGASEKRIAG